MSISAHDRNARSLRWVQLCLTEAITVDCLLADVGCRLKHHLGNDFQVNIVFQLHVLGVDAEHLQPTCLIGNADIDFTIESAEAPQGWVNTAHPVSCSGDSSRPILTIFGKNLTIYTLRSFSS